MTCCAPQDSNVHAFTVSRLYSSGHGIVEAAASLAVRDPNRAPRRTTAADDPPAPLPAEHRAYERAP